MFNLGLLILLTTAFMSKEATIDQTKALVLARQTPEVEAFYQLENGKLADCIRSNITESCNSSLVTCLEDAWVIEFFLMKHVSILRQPQAPIADPTQCV